MQHLFTGSQVLLSFFLLEPWADSLIAKGTRLVDDAHRISFECAKSRSKEEEEEEEQKKISKRLIGAQRAD